MGLADLAISDSGLGGLVDSHGFTVKSYKNMKGYKSAGTSAGLHPVVAVA